MTTYYLNGNPITEGSDITLNGMVYPYSWLEGTSPAVRASLGIEKHGDINYDTKYYWGVDNPRILEDREEVDEENNPLYLKIRTEVNGISTITDSDVRVVTLGLKTTCTAEVRSTTNQLLTPTDYLIIRNHVEETEIPADVTTYRGAVIAEQDRVVTAIAATTTVEQLVTVMSSIAWPRAE
jgi:hypothetical protein